MKYNVSKAESARLGIPRVKIGGDSSSSSSSSKSSGSSSTGKFSYDPDLSNLKKLQEKYLGSLKPTSEETGLEKQLSNLMTSRDLGIEQTRNRTIESPLIRGESAAKMRTAEIQSQPLIARLSQLQAQRQANNQALSSMLGFENQALDRQFQTAQEKARQAQIKWENEMANKRLSQSSGSGYGTSSSFNLGGWNPWENQGQSTIPTFNTPEKRAITFADLISPDKNNPFLKSSL